MANAATVKQTSMRPPIGGDGSDVQVDLRVADEQWLTRLLLRLAPYAEVVRPPEFTDSFIAAAQSALSLFDEPDVD